MFHPKKPRNSSLSRSHSRTIVPFQGGEKEEEEEETGSLRTNEDNECLRCHQNMTKSGVMPWTSQLDRVSVEGNITVNFLRVKIPTKGGYMERNGERERGEGEESRASVSLLPLSGKVYICVTNPHWHLVVHERVLKPPAENCARIDGDRTFIKVWLSETWYPLIFICLVFKESKNV